LYFNANTDTILLSVDVDTLLENRGPTAVREATLLDDVSESDDNYEEANSTARGPSSPREGTNLS
jgi:hypothetical protein